MNGQPGRRDNLKKAIAVKIKFYKEIAAMVLGWNDGKSSVKIGARDGKKTTRIGNVTIHEKYVKQIVVGKPLRVKYRYATEAKKLYQPKLDTTDDGQVMADQLLPDSIKCLKFEGKEEG